MKILNKVKKISYMHYICVCITLIFLLMSIFVFPNAFTRVIESFKDLGRSFGYYIQEMFYFDWGIEPSVNSYSKVPDESIFGLPSTFEEFKVVWFDYWNKFSSSENVYAYFSSVGKFLFNTSRILMLIGVPLFLLLYLLFQKYLSDENNDYNKDSKPLKVFKKISSFTYIPVKNWLIKFFTFVKENKNYYILWLLIWAYNFNIVTIVIEFVAFYLYFVMSFDIKSIYIQVVKLFLDLSVPIAFIPAWCWVIIAYLVICVIRKNIGYNRLDNYEHRNCGFINERPIVLMVCGTMGKKKTTAITDMALSQEVMFRDKAFEKILDNDLKFPNFPWINLENALIYAMKKHYIYNLATCRRYIDLLEYFFNLNYSDKATFKSVKRHLLKCYNLKHNNLIFDYDYERYGLFFDDKLKVSYIWEIIKTYSQLYFIYVIESSLMVTNYSIRTDMLIDDLGNFPRWNTDFFKRDSKLIDSFSRHSHILDFDSLRLGRTIIEDNYKKDSFEFGVVIVTEIGKERKNNLELKETKKGEFLANQKNDGFNDYLKMCRHSATVDNFPFIKFITDEQRPESWGADARDLCEIVHIRETTETKLAMPLFFIEELLHSFLFKKFKDLYYQYRFVRSDNTLPLYIYKSLASKFHNYYLGVYNTFGYCNLNVQVESGTQDGQIDEKKYYLMSKKIYSKRFSTDCFSDFFTHKALQSPIGINDLEEYGTEKATFDELKKQNSYFINDLVNRQKTDD